MTVSVPLREGFEQLVSSDDALQACVLIKHAKELDHLLVKHGDGVVKRVVRGEALRRDSI